MQRGGATSRGGTTAPSSPPKGLASLPGESTGKGRAKAGRRRRGRCCCSVWCLFALAACCTAVFPFAQEPLRANLLEALIESESARPFAPDLTALVMHRTGYKLLNGTHPYVCHYVPYEVPPESVPPGPLLSDEDLGPLEPNLVEGICKQAKDECNKDAHCHENKWQQYLESVKCAPKRLMVCLKRTEVLRPPSCRLCVEAWHRDRIVCDRSTVVCENTRRECFEATYGGGPETASMGNLKWLGFWNADKYKPDEFAGWASFGWTKDTEQICRGAKMGMRHLYKLNAVLFERWPPIGEGGADTNGLMGDGQIKVVQEDEELPPPSPPPPPPPTGEADPRAQGVHVGGAEMAHKQNMLRLRPDYEERWAELLPTLKDLVKSGAVFGFYLGDELVWNGLPVEDLRRSAKLVRRDFPEEVIWINEAKPVLTGGRDTYHQDVNFTMVPEEVSWFSVDQYHTSPSTTFKDKLRRLYESHVFPKMHPHQKAVVVPGAFASARNKECNEQCYDQFCARDAWESYRWAREDPRVTAIAPYHWIPCDRCFHSQNEIGARDMNLTSRAYREIGTRILAGRHWDPADEWARVAAGAESLVARNKYLGKEVRKVDKEVSRSASGIIEQYMVDPRVPSDDALVSRAGTADHINPRDVLRGLDTNRHKGDRDAGGGSNPAIRSHTDAWLAEELSAGGHADKHLAKLMRMGGLMGGLGGSHSIEEGSDGAGGAEEEGAGAAGDGGDEGVGDAGEEQEGQR